MTAKQIFVFCEGTPEEILASRMVDVTGIMASREGDHVVVCFMSDRGNCNCNLPRETGRSFANALARTIRGEPVDWFGDQEGLDDLEAFVNGDFVLLTSDGEYVQLNCQCNQILWNLGTHIGDPRLRILCGQIGRWTA